MQWDECDKYLGTMNLCRIPGHQGSRRFQPLGWTSQIMDEPTTIHKAEEAARDVLAMGLWQTSSPAETHQDVDWAAWSMLCCGRVVKLAGDQNGSSSLLHVRQNIDQLLVRSACYMVICCRWSVCVYGWGINCKALCIEVLHTCSPCIVPGSLL